MTQLEECLTKYVNQRVAALEKYVLDALKNQNKFVLSVDPLQLSLDLKNCEFLKDAAIFSEENPLLNLNGCFRVFRLTTKGREFAEKLEQDFTGREEIEAQLLLNR
jgi:hypothetical protein